MSPLQRRLRAGWGRHPRLPPNASLCIFRKQGRFLTHAVHQSLPGTRCPHSAVLSNSRSAFQFGQLPRYRTSFLAVCFSCPGSGAGSLLPSDRRVSLSSLIQKCYSSFFCVPAHGHLSRSTGRLFCRTPLGLSWSDCPLTISVRRFTSGRSAVSVPLSSSQRLTPRSSRRHFVAASFLRTTA